MITKRKVKVYDMQYLVDELKVNNVPFLLESTSMTKKVTTEDTIYSYLDSKVCLNMYELNLIKQVKKDAEKLDLKQFKPVQARDITYINLTSKKMPAVQEGDFFEVDLKQAYWNIAYIKGIISKETYLYANNPKIKKRARLVALGALAKKVTSVEFDGEKFGKVIVGEELEYARLFYACCMEVAGIMTNIMREVGDNYLFHWVDAIFIKNNSGLDILIQYLNILHEEIKKDFPLFSDVFFKVIPCHKIEKKSSKIIVHSNFHDRKIREFNFQKTKKRIKL